MTRQTWSRGELEIIKKMRIEGRSIFDIATELDRPYGSVEGKLWRMKQDGLMEFTKVPQSPYPILTEYPKLEGDWIIFPDIEAPFQNAEFINHVLDLADSWGIRRAILAGDFLHFEALSRWGAKWEGTVGNHKQEELAAFVAQLPRAHKANGEKLLVSIGIIGEGTIIHEIGHAKEIARELGKMDRIIYIMGNHDDRLIRKLEQSLSVTNLGDLLRVNEIWEMSPYYFCTIETSHGLFRVSHPRGASQGEPSKLASQFLCHVMVAHSHRWSMTKDQSGKFWAIHMGHAVDESRLAYVMQRDVKRDAHALGSVILRDGYPYLLGENTDWEKMKRM